MAHILHDADEFQEKPNERIRQRSHHEKQTKSEQRDSKEGQGEAAPLAVGNAAESAARDRPITGFRDKKNRRPLRLFLPAEEVLADGEKRLRLSKWPGARQLAVEHANARPASQVILYRKQLASRLARRVIA